MAKKYLVLENGAVFAGESFGSTRDTVAEIVFNTSMVGYIEALTDPTYKGQAIVQTFPLLGNYGVNSEDHENVAVYPAAYIVREHCIHPSNFRSEGTLDAFLQKNDIPGLCGIDTRALTRMLRDNGTMNGAIVDDPASVDMEALKAYRVTSPVAEVTCKEVYTEGDGEKTVAVIDYGLRRSLLESVIKRGFKAVVFPAGTSADAILAADPDGILLSNGPGDPADCLEEIAIIKKLIASHKPIMGVCLGHQLLALANGFATEKLPYGHRGGNQPVRSDDGQVYITTQTHGYAVISDSIDKSVASELFVNVNDGSNEGLIYHNINAFSTQFQPEAHRCADTTSYLFDRFAAMIDGEDK